MHFFNLLLIVLYLPLLQIIKTDVMYSEKTQIRVRYGETDRMGYVYYGNYAEYYEVGRIDMLRKLGFSYKIMEDEGLLLPVLNFNIKYIKPAFFDDLLTVTTSVSELPASRIKFNYEIHNEIGELLNIGFTELVFINKNTNKPCRPPEDFMKAISAYF